MKEQILWTSEPMKIGKHFWRIGVAIYTFPKLRLVDGKMKCLDPKERHRCTFYEWRSEQSHVWNDKRMWPTFNDNDGMYAGLPKTLTKLYDRERETVRAFIDGTAHSAESTSEGWQIWPWHHPPHVCRVARAPFDGGRDVWGYYTAEDVAAGVPEQALERARREMPDRYHTELTPEGEQAVIPGCERNASPKAGQLDLF